ncbi:MAG: pilus assembly protein [Deltaproteobacteria bacterium]|nr:pilus assembly protein [Deltaproteobacteria bacterium]
MKNRTFSNSYCRQQGAVLAVSLIILLLLTIIGLASTSTSIMDTLMAGNAQYQTQALASAERTLKFAEDRIETIALEDGIFDFAATGDAFYSLSDGLDVHQLDWKNRSFSVERNLDGDPATDDMYIVEFVGSKPVPGESTKVKQGGSVKGSNVYTHRVTARSATQKGAERVVQSIYVTFTEL